MKKEIKKIFKNFKNLNKEIDSEQEILCDRLHDLELSHNRKLRLLEKIKKQLIEIKHNKPGYNPSTEIKHWYQEQNDKQIQQIIDKIKQEINAPLRVRSKPIMKIKMEPLIVPKMDRPFKPKDIFYWKGWKND